MVLYSVPIPIENSETETDVDRIHRMKAMTLSFTMRGFLSPQFTLEDRFDLMKHARLELDAIGVRDTELMTYDQLLTAAELISGERTVDAA